MSPFPSFATVRLSVDREAADGGAHARAAGRSWWAARFLNGTILHEWDADPGSLNGHMDWPRLAMLGKLKGISALRLYAPDGKMVEVGGDGDQTGRLFQFKVAARYLRAEDGSSLPGLQILGRETLAHVIGIVTGHDGQCSLFAWEWIPRPEPPAGAPPVPVKPNYFNREQPLWALKEQHENYEIARKKYEDFIFGPEVRDWNRRATLWDRSARGRLAGPIQDNVYSMEYQHVGRLSADHLGLSDGEGR